MPIKVADIEFAQIPLDQKILHFLASSAENAFTMEEIMKELGSEMPYFMTQADDGAGFLLGLLVDVGLESRRNDVRSVYSQALLQLGERGQIRAFDYLGSRLYAISQKGLTVGARGQLGPAS